MKKPKFNFIPERQLNTNVEAVSITKVNIFGNGQLNFNRETVEQFELHDKFFRFLVDIESRALAWQIVEGKLDEDNSSDLRQFKVTQLGVVSISIKKLLGIFGIPIIPCKKSFLMNKYSSALHANDLYYITIPSLLEWQNEADALEKDKQEQTGNIVA